MSVKQTEKALTRCKGEGDTNQLHVSSSFNRGKRSNLETGDTRETLTKSPVVISRLCQGQFIYVRDKKEGWIAGSVVDTNNSAVTVALGQGQTKTIVVNIQDVLLRSEDRDFSGCDNLTQVTPMNEASVLDCLHQRFSQNIFYTAAGTTIVAVNPFKDLPQLYDIHKIQEYHQSQLTAAPHIYVIAEKAYLSMVWESGKVNQSIIVSGESGAGKTVSAKHLLRYLTIVSSPEHELDLESSVPGSVIERQVLDSNPILEAFGNAATPRNENSSRFGKFIQLQFHRNGYILGGIIQTYLLEKTRVVHQGLGENNFHIFYQLMSLADLSPIPDWLEEVKRDVTYSKLPSTVPQQAETISVLQTVEAMADIGIAPATQVSVFQALLAILHLTTLKFVSTRDDEASSVSDDEDCVEAMIEMNWAKEESCRLLGISTESLHQVLLNRNIVSGAKSRQSIFIKPVSVREAQSRRDCLAMLLYARLFDWVVTFINKQIQAAQHDHSINLLDIYGFEVFTINSLEQLCINYANERLQQHYVIHFLRDLQVEYEMEHIPWTNVSYNDNRVCVEALDSPTGVFGVLNEEVSLNRKSNDSSLCGRIVATCGDHGVVRKQNIGTYETKFFVRHYAGEVLYTVDEAVTKNRDNIPSELISLLATSSNDFIHNLFSGDEFAHTEQSLTPTKARKKKTLLMKFKSSLDSLISTLGESEVYYIRCIKPNRVSQADHFDRQYVLEQLEACGTLETVNICRMGYPARMSYQDFIQRYGLFLRLNNISDHLEGQLGSDGHIYRGGEFCEANKENEESLYERIVTHLSSHDGHAHHTSPKKLRRTSGLNEEHKFRLAVRILTAAFTSEELHGCHHQCGPRKIFLTQKQFEDLEHIRANLITVCVIKAQAAWRGNAQRRRLQRMKEASVKIQAMWRAFRGRNIYHQIKGATVLIQKGWRQYKLWTSVKMLARSSRIVKRTLRKWVRVYRGNRAQTFLLAQYQIMERDSSSSKEGSSTERSDCCVSTSGTTCYLDAQESIGCSTTTTDSSPRGQRVYEGTDDIESGLDDSSGAWSDDSGVMIKDYIHSLPAEEPSFGNTSPEGAELDLEAPPAKMQKLNLRSDLRMGNGIVTCRRLTKPGYRFHVRKGVLKHGHLIHRSELPHGLPDALSEETADTAVTDHTGDLTDVLK